MLSFSLPDIFSSSSQFITTVYLISETVLVISYIHHCKIFSSNKYSHACDSATKSFADSTHMENIARVTRPLHDILVGIGNDNNVPSRLHK